ncbi:MAG: flagellar motor switch protein FliN [Oscillibacter sp.]|nr:flagellar motor switch protein FliN [Oscillibacter sp.]
MTDKSLTPMELDALGEVMNISLGSSATAVSNILGHRVEITTPAVTVVTNSEFPMDDLLHVIGVEVHYVSGLAGNNLLILKRKDAQMIVDTLMGNEFSNGEFEKDELSVSALCEVMNQMMGSAATALSNFLGFSVNISTPEYFELDDLVKLKEKCYQPNEDVCVVVRFTMKIEGIVESQFINAMSMELAQKLLSGLGISDDGQEESGPAAEEPALSDEGQGGGVLSQEEIERLINGGSAKEPEIPAVPKSDRPLSQEEIEKLLHPEPEPAPAAPAPQPQAQPTASPMPPMPQMPGGPYGYPGGAMPGGYQMPPYGAYMPGYYPPSGYYPAPNPKVVDAREAEMAHLHGGEAPMTRQEENLQLLMSVPMEVSVEIGRTQKKVKDVLTFSKGTLVVLDRLAGDQVDLFVNGKCIAKGDVVVIDDNFGIRITEVLSLPTVEELRQNNRK